MPDFVEEPEVCLAIDAVARRYGILPHQVLELDPWDLGLARECILAAERSVSESVAKMQAQGGFLPMPIPVINIG